jgi:outer membrane lipoprotein-sorting protein
MRIPLCYATRTVLVLDKNTYFPKKLESYGEKGDLYERYEWQNLNLNPNLTDLDFDPNNKEYDF